MYETIIEAYPELINKDFDPSYGIITLSDDGDGIIYLSKWEYHKPIPEGLKLGK